MELTHQDNLSLSVIPPKRDQAWCKSNSKPSQTTSQMTDPVTNSKQKAMVRDASQTSLWHQDLLQSCDNYLWEVFYHHTFSTNARHAQCLHHMHNTHDLWWCCCARADSPSLTLFKVLNSILLNSYAEAMCVYNEIFTYTVVEKEMEKKGEQM